MDMGRELISDIELVAAYKSAENFCLVVAGLTGMSPTEVGELCAFEAMQLIGEEVLKRGLA